MSTLKTQYKNWGLKNPNSQLTYVEWLEKFNEIHNLPTDMSVWDVTLMDGLENEPRVSDDFQIGPDGAYEHTDDMTPREKASELIVKFQTGVKSLDYNEAKECALICCNEVLLNISADRGYVLWLEVKQEVEKLRSKGYAEPSVDQIIQESYELGMIQNHKEIYGAAKFFKTLNVKNFMEIGTDQGGTFAIWSKLSQDGIRISIDLPHGKFGGNDYDPVKRDNYLRSLGSDVTMIWGSSHDEIIKEKVSSILGCEKLDFLFIDGDHTYEGVKQDYEMYRDFVKPGGWIGFHDVKDTEFHRSVNCRVDKLWTELEKYKKNWCDSSSNYGGIGFMQIDN